MLFHNHYLAMGLHATCSLLKDLRTAIYSFPKGCVGDVCDRSRLPSHGSVFMVISLQLLPPSGRSSRAVPSYSASQSRCATIIFLRLVQSKVPRVISAPASMVLTTCAVSFFHFWGGQPLHNVQSFILHSLMEVLTIYLTTSSSTVFLKILPDVLSFLRRSCFFMSCSLIPWCSPVSLDVSSRTFVLYGFLM
jgi:hypothetical protein